MTDSALMQTLRESCEEHLRVAALYERGGNSSGARQLRAVANLLGYIIQGGKPTTVLPAPTKDDMNMDDEYKPEDDYDPDTDPELQAALAQRDDTPFDPDWDDVGGEA